MGKGYTGIQHFEAGSDESYLELIELRNALHTCGYKPRVIWAGWSFEVCNHPLRCMVVESNNIRKFLADFERHHFDWYARNQEIATVYHDYFSKVDNRMLVVVIDEQCLFSSNSLRIITEALAQSVGANALPKQRTTYISPNSHENEEVSTVGQRALLHLEERLLTSLA